MCADCRFWVVRYPRLPSSQQLRRRVGGCDLRRVTLRFGEVVDMARRRSESLDELVVVRIGQGAWLSGGVDLPRIWGWGPLR
ncbi:hypothetical protein HBI56_221110 [Parastagonospora nodorum]|nr:hypothetical protein HBH56_232990 [Parastagonospora nodorum]KAH3921419.1 hypothetical protein HBH54_240070 [Parastagonospora nodorum]KAH3956240.1 hypothetical protein HBH51_246360 [Parastagonospora nodorum]KAH4013445.1 hypothetical protein HBI09_214900 [Parastagonospora nodorum]KAH4045146.1 hypothetical protein HBH49_205570 [Parastagonospora nodorum]